MCKDLSFGNIPCPTVATVRPRFSFLPTYFDEEGAGHRVPFHLAAHGDGMCRARGRNVIDFVHQTH